jgi:hypothetical protein
MVSTLLILLGPGMLCIPVTLMLLLVLLLVLLMLCLLMVLLRTVHTFHLLQGDKFRLLLLLWL